jgi:D-beta-D-heptose 7-phosphate kinase/D-beta-D-heptose 1-phosphate adenosyltransferase
MRVGIISGYFNPIHTGHLDYIEGAKEKCDLLYVIVNSDRQVDIKGSKQFMDEVSRLRIIRALVYVNKAMVSIDDDSTVCRSIKSIHKQCCDDPFVSDIYFMNGGDRGQGTVPEAEVCEELDIKMIYNVGGVKTESSSTLLQKVANAK